MTKSRVRIGPSVLEVAGQCYPSTSPVTSEPPEELPPCTFLTQCLLVIYAVGLVSPDATQASGFCTLMGLCTY